jgi:predicted transcriptional regulator
MPDPLKHLYNKKLLSSLCKEIKCVYKRFNSKSFSNYVFDNEWDNKELKERMKHISEALHKYFLKIMEKIYVKM